MSQLIWVYPFWGNIFINVTAGNASSSWLKHKIYMISLHWFMSQLLWVNLWQLKRWIYSSWMWLLNLTKLSSWRLATCLVKQLCWFWYLRLSQPYNWQLKYGDISQLSETYSLEFHSWRSRESADSKFCILHHLFMWTLLVVSEFWTWVNH